MVGLKRELVSGREGELYELRMRCDQLTRTVETLEQQLQQQVCVYVCVCVCACVPACVCVCVCSGVPRQVLRVLEHPHHKESSRSIGITPVLLGLLARYTSTCTGTNLQVANNSYKL